MEARLSRLEEVVSDLSETTKSMAQNLVKLTEVQVTQAHHEGVLDRIVSELGEARRDINGVGGRIGIVESRQQQIARDVDDIGEKLSGEKGLVARMTLASGRIDSHTWSLRLLAGTLATLLGAILFWVIRSIGGGAP